MTDQDNERPELQERLYAMLEFPDENASTDYKEAKAFCSKKNDFAAKLVKHILAMANFGGGYLVIGYSERNGKLKPDPKMTDKVTGSYDPTSLSQFVGKHVRGEEKPHLTIEKVVYHEHSYPIICIEGFPRNPFFCGSGKMGEDNKPILKEGALYVRDQHTRTVSLASPAQWEELISRCIQKRKSDMLGAFGKILSEIQSGEPHEETHYLKKFESLVTRERDSARKQLEKNNVAIAGWYCWHSPIDPSEHFDVKQLRDAAERSVRPNTGRPMGLTRRGNKTVVPVTDGLRMHYTVTNRFADYPISFEHWFLHNRGGYFLYRFFPRTKDEATVAVNWGVRVWSIGEAIDHCLALYEALDVDMNTEIHFSLVHEGLEDGYLTCSENSSRMLPRRYTCKIESVPSSWNGSLATLRATRKDLTVKLSQELFTRFDFCDLSNKVLCEVYDEYAKSRI